jgi:uncharacterized protein YwgA
MQNDTLKRETESILISKETEIKEQYKFGLFGGYSFNISQCRFPISALGAELLSAF